MIGPTDLLHPSPTPHFKTSHVLKPWLEINPNHAATKVFKAVWLRTQFLWDVTQHCCLTGPSVSKEHNAFIFKGLEARKKNRLRSGTMGTKKPFSPRTSRSSPQSSTKTDSITYLFIYYRRDIIFILTASMTKICEALYLCFQICHVMLPYQTPVQLYLFCCYYVLTIIRISYVNKELVIE
jgi:hypothetical protein